MKKQSAKQVKFEMLKSEMLNTTLTQFQNDPQTWGLSSEGNDDVYFDLWLSEDDVTMLGVDGVELYQIKNGNVAQMKYRIEKIMRDYYNAML
jgi:hypothetical protein